MKTWKDHSLLRELADAVEAGVPVVLASVVATKRSVPRRAGTKMLVFADGRLVGTVGGGEMESRVIEDAKESLRSGKTSLLTYTLVAPDRGDPGVCGGEVQIYLEPHMPPHTVLVIGAGHVGRAVVSLAKWLGYHTVVTDDRDDAVADDAIADADVQLGGSVSEALGRYEITADTSVVLVSRSVGIDVEAIPLLLASPARYIGVMGSQRRWMTTRSQLEGAGVEPSTLGRIHAPVGIEIGAETVEEIAVSIMSEVIRVARASTEEG